MCKTEYAERSFSVFRVAQYEGFINLFALFTFTLVKRARQNSNNQKIKWSANATFYRICKLAQNENQFQIHALKNK